MSIVARRAWQVLFVIAALIFLLGIGDIAGGVAFEPTTPLAISGQSIDQLQAGSPAAYRVIDFGSRHGGINLVLIGLLLAALAWFPYRAGRRWAWFAMWTLPAWAIGSLVVGLVYGFAAGQGIPAAMLSGPVFSLIAAVLLLLDAGRFRRPEAAGG